MENSPSDDHVAAVAARLPPVRYYAPFEEEEEEPVQDPDSPRSPGQVSDDYSPLKIVNRGQPSVDYWADLEIVNDDKNAMDDDDEPTQLEKEPVNDSRWSPEDRELYCPVDPNDPESVRKGWEQQSKRFAVHTLRHYNAHDHCNGGVKYELVEATGSQGIVLDSGHIIGHVTFTARATAGHDPTVPQQADPRPFFAEVHAPDLAPTCMISMDDGEERGEHDDLCQFCGANLKHPKVHPDLHRRRKRSISRHTWSATNAIMDCDP
jgi:hypothetical protein